MTKTLTPRQGSGMHMSSAQSEEETLRAWGCRYQMGISTHVLLSVTCGAETGEGETVPKVLVREKQTTYSSQTCSQLWPSPDGPGWPNYSPGLPE